MVMTYQYGYGVQHYGEGGFGGFAEKYAEQPYIASDEPLIAYSNAIAQSGAQLVTDIGAYQGGSAADNNPLNPLRMSSVGGIVKMTYLPPSGGVTQGYGAGVYGRVVPQSIPMNCLILAASRHESAGYRTPPNRVRVFAESGFGAGGFNLGDYGGSVVDKKLSPSANASEVIQFQPVNAVRVSMTFFGLPAAALFPEIFLGNALKMPFLEMGFDPYHEVSTGVSFMSESGREYPQLRYRKMELSPRWSYLDQARWQALDRFRETCLELKAPFYFSWMPNSRPNETYCMRNNAKVAAMPYVTAQHRSLSLNLVEVL